MGFWALHGLLGGILFIVMLLALPRLTLFFGAIVFGSIGIGAALGGALGGLLGFLLWIFLPRTLAAILGTVVYWQTNPLLVLLGWVAAIALELVEKLAVKMAVS